MARRESEGYRFSRKTEAHFSEILFGHTFTEKRIYYNRKSMVSKSMVRLTMKTPLDWSVLRLFTLTEVHLEQASTRFLWRAMPDKLANRPVVFKHEGIGEYQCCIEMILNGKSIHGTLSRLSNLKHITNGMNINLQSVQCNN